MQHCVTEILGGNRDKPTMIQVNIIYRGNSYAELCPVMAVLRYGSEGSSPCRATDYSSGRIAPNYVPYKESICSESLGGTVI